MGLSNAVPKPAPRWRTKQQARAAEAKQMKEAFRQVEARDGRACRVCKRRLQSIGVVDGWHHHHLQYRSRGGEHTTDNLVLLCPKCHTAVHDAEIRLSGDADLRSKHTGALCGVVLEQYSEAGWRKERVL